MQLLLRTGITALCDAAAVSIMKIACSSFYACSYSTLLPGAENRIVLQGQSVQTGSGWKPSWDSHPSGDLPEPPSLRDPLRGYDGAEVSL